MCQCAFDRSFIFQGYIFCSWKCFDLFDQFINRCRIQNALELIRKGELPISQIGWECGIGEYKYFSHVFKKYMGCSVREYQSTLK